MQPFTTEGIFEEFGILENKKNCKTKKTSKNIWRVKIKFIHLHPLSKTPQEVRCSEEKISTITEFEKLGLLKEVRVLGVHKFRLRN